MLTKLKLALLVSAPLVAGATTYAAAQAAPPDRKALRAELDTNGDGKLDDAERAAGRAMFEARRAERHQQMLARHDANKDGVLDDTERAAARDTRLTDRFKAMDTNGDGKLSLDEFKAGNPGKAGFGRHGRHARAGQGRTPGMKP